MFKLAVLIAVLSGYVSSQLTSTSFNLTCTWLAGTNISVQPVAYGTPGFSSPVINPGSRSAGCSAPNIVGPDTFFLYGGAGSISCTFQFCLFHQLIFIDGDFWSFDLDSAWWTTIHLSQSQNFGLQGVASSTTFPGLKNAIGCATAANTNFYLFGGGNLMNFLFQLMIDQVTITCGAMTFRSDNGHGSRATEHIYLLKA